MKAFRSEGVFRISPVITELGEYISKVSEGDFEYKGSDPNIPAG